MHGEGVAEIAACVDELLELGYLGPLSIEHEPYDRDPTRRVHPDARADRGAARRDRSWRPWLSRAACASGSSAAATSPARTGQTAEAYPNVEIVGATDIDRVLSAAFVERFGGIDYPDLEALIADPAIDAVVNLTSHGMPRRGDDGRPRGRQARPQREADGGELRRGTPPRRARRREGPAALVLADHLHGRRPGDRVEPDRERRDRQRPRRLRRGQLGPHRDVASAARSRSTRSGRWRTSASTRSRS